jgi:hypothetical protein
MKFTGSFFLVVALSSTLFGQQTAPTSSPRTFHIQGTVTDPIGAVIPNAKVTFQRGQFSQTLVTNSTGRYEANLPLGDYTLAAQTAGFKTYRRPPFRVSGPSHLTFDVRLQLGRCGDMVIISGSGRPPTDAEIYAATESCRHEDLFPWSNDGGHFQLSIQFETRIRAADAYSYSGASREDPVSVAYNLFSLHADRVVYNAKEKTMEARGDVVMEDEYGKRSADAITFKLEDSQPKQLR